MNRILLVATKRCNLHCEYCYVKKDNTKIDLNTAFKALEFLGSIDNQEAKQLIITGGEPVLEFELMKKIVIKARRIYGNKLLIGVPSNGTIIKKKYLEFFKQYNVSIGISIDGTRKDNKYRDDIRTKSINDRLYEKIPLFLKFNDIIRVRLTIHPNLAKRAYNNFLYFLKLGFKKIDIQPAIGILWKKSQIKEYVSQLKKIIDISIKNKIDLKSLVEGIECIDTAYCGKIRNEIMIDTDGSIYPCAFFLFLRRDIRKKFEIGNIFNRNELYENKYVDYVRSFRICNLKGKCNECSSSRACTKFCLAFDLKTRRYNKLLAESNLLLEKQVERLMKKLRYSIKDQKINK